MGARTYRTFKQVLRASKTRKAGKGKPQAKKKTRRVKRHPFFAGAGAGAAQKKQKGGNPVPFSGESTVVGRSLDDDEETPFTLQSAAAYTASLPT